jgi:hypothetical protein
MHTPCVLLCNMHPAVGDKDEYQAEPHFDEFAAGRKDATHGARRNMIRPLSAKLMSLIVGWKSIKSL